MVVNSSSHSVCPYCHTPLRLPAGGRVSLEVPCPDCGKLLSIETRDGEVFVSRPSSDPVSPVAKGLAVPPRSRWSKPEWPRRIGQRVSEGLREPLVLTWLAAGIAAVLLGIAFYRAGTAPSIADVADVVPDVEVEKNPAEGLPEADSGRALAAVVAPRPVVSSVAAAGITPVPPKVPARLPVTAARPEVSNVNPREMAELGLSQRVLRFEQTEPVSFETVRGELAEVVGAPIRYATGIEPVETEVSLSVSDATLAEILRELTRQAGLSFRIDAEGVVLEASETP